MGDNMSYDNTNKGSIWRNDRKQTDKHPDFNGTLNVEGVEYWVSAWKRKPGDNPKSPALRFAINPKEQQSNHQSQQQGFDDDVPF